MLTVGDRLTLTAIDLDYKGQGVCKPEGYVIFVAGLLPGEKAEVEIIKLKKAFGEGQLIKLLKVSKYRTHDTSKLGSIELYHLHHDKQIEWQAIMTKNTFSKIAHQDITLNQTIHDDRVINYRNKSVFHVLPGSILKLGLYQKDYSLVYVPSFVLCDSLTNRFVNLINRIQAPIETDALKHIVFRTNENQQLLITFVAIKKEVQGLKELVQKLAREKEVVGITLNLKAHDKQILGQQSIVLYGENAIKMRIHQYEVVINDRSFFQVNWPVMEIVYDVIGQYVNQGQHVVEAYSGVGSIGLSIYDKVKKITMIEANKENINMTNQTIKQYQLNRIELIEGRAERLIHHYDGDLLIVDPPRNGLYQNFTKTIMDMSFQTIIYLSCDLKTLARDVDRLSAHYKVTAVYPIRMFPQTIAMETLVILQKKNALK